MRRWSVLLALLAAACQKEVVPAPQVTFDGGYASDREAILVHGERLTHVLGCTGCHGGDLQGELFTKNHPEWGPLYASNLTVEVPEYTDAQLEGIIRHGTHPERKSVWGMPSQIFQNLSDPDYKALVTYLRTLKPTGKKTPPPRFSAADKKDIASGVYKPAVRMVSDFKHAQPIDLGPRYALGRYITTVTCEECHGSDLNGDPIDKTPNLVVASGYTRAEFEKLITEGIPTGNRKLKPMMHDVAVGRFSHLTKHERHALYNYLKARAEQP